MHRLLREIGLPDGTTPETLHGGMICRATRVGEVVLKEHVREVPALFPAEAAGLRFLGRHGARVPEVLAVGEDGLVLSYVAPAKPDWPALGSMMRALHAQRGEAYGADDPVFLGDYRLPSGTSSDWGEFWFEARIEPWMHAAGDLAPRLRSLRWDRLPTEGPCPLHGDLWVGNVIFGEAGPVLIDPSAWWGERSVDIAMMLLFDGFPREFWHAYGPIPPEIKAALPPYLIYYLLAHVHFFGAEYVPRLRLAVDDAERALNS